MVTLHEAIVEADILFLLQLHTYESKHAFGQVLEIKELN